MVTDSVFIFLFFTRGYKIWKLFSEILNQRLLKPLVTVIKGSNKCVNYCTLASKNAAQCAYKTLQFCVNGILKFEFKYFPKFQCYLQRQQKFSSSYCIPWSAGLTSHNCPADSQIEEPLLLSRAPFPLLFIFLFFFLYLLLPDIAIYMCLSAFMCLLCVHAYKHTHACSTQWILYIRGQLSKISSLFYPVYLGAPTQVFSLINKHPSLMSHLGGLMIVIVNSIDDWLNVICVI